MRIASNGNIGIGTNNPATIFQVGSGGRLRLANDDYTLIGARDVNGYTNTKIVLWTAGNLEYNATSATGSHVFFTTDSGTERMRIASNGYVGIGITNPAYPLDVQAGTTNLASAITVSYIGNPNTTVINANTSAFGFISTRCQGAIWCMSWILSSSDVRIKEDIQDINDDNALQSILSIEPKTYKYVDKIEKGDKKVYGFIAQQIREVIPDAVKIEKAYIPNIYLVAYYNNYIITLPSQPTKVVIKVDDKIKCYDKDNKELLVEVIEIIDALTFRIKDTEYSDTKIFVYGTFVDDFHTLNKDYIFTLNVCATQELHRRIEAQSLLIKSHEDRIKELETKMERMLSVTT